MYCVIVMCVETKRVLKKADLRHPSCTVVMYRRKSASPVHNVLTTHGQYHVNELHETVFIRSSSGCSHLLLNPQVMSHLNPVDTLTWYAFNAILLIFSHSYLGLPNIIFH